jgi:hypothetical protein
LRAAGRENKLATIAAKLGIADKVEKPEIDDRTAFWLNAYSLAERGRPYTNGFPLPLPPLNIIALVDALSLAAEPDEAVVVVCSMDDAWIKWRDSKQGKKAK